MLKILKLIKAAEAQGFATAAEKSVIDAEFKALGAEEQEMVKAQVDAIEKMAESSATGPDAELEKNLRTLVEKAVGQTAGVKVDALVTEAKSQILDFFEKQKAAFAQGAGLGHPDVAAKRKGINEWMRKFMGAILQNDNATLKEMTSDSTGTPYAGYATTTELSTEIRSIIGQYGVARREFLTVQLSKARYEQLTLVTDLSVFWVGEGQVIPSTQVVLGKTPLVLKKLAAIVTMTRELLLEQEIDLFAFVGTRVGEGMARMEDRAFFMGTGGGDTANADYLGIVNALTTVVTIPVRGSLNGQSFAHINPDDLMALQNAVSGDVAETAKYYGNRTIRNTLRTFKDGNGQYIYQGPTDGGPATVWGKPWVEVEVMPGIAATAADKKFVMFADLKRAALLGYNGGIEADRFNSGVVRNVAANADINLITTDREAVRWIELVGYTAVELTAGAVLKTAAA